VKRFLTTWEEYLELTWVHLHDVAGRMKKCADKDKWDTHFDVRDMVFLRITEDQFHPLKGTARSLTRKYEGPFSVKKQVWEVAYDLDLLNHMHWKHPVFHMSQLKRCRLDAHHPERIALSRGPAMIVDRPNLILDKILDLMTVGVRSATQREFFVRWKDAPEESGWETEDSLWRWKKEIA